MSNGYDAPRHVVKRPIIHSPSATGLSVPGTAASDTVLLRSIMPANLTVSGTAYLRLTTGGTAAGPSITFGKSLAGTGAVSAIGTYTFGTSANGARATLSLTSTDFDPGDELVVTNVAGTAASTPVIIFSLSAVETLE
jgi:hypothetical protein